MDILRENDVDFPDELEDMRRLGPFATEFRYDELPAESEEAFDRQWAADCIRRIRTWAENIINAGQEKP